MKKYILILFTLAILTGCAGAYKQASQISSQSYIGMPIDKFKALAGNKATLEAMEAGYTVYKMKDFDAWTGQVIDTKFYYFNSEAKLVKIDGGEFKQKRYQVEVINH